MIYISGPGHGSSAPAVLATAIYLEGTYSEVYPNVSQDFAGLKKLFKQFSFPGGISSHVSPQTPGSIHEGGEFGVFDRPRLRGRYYPTIEDLVVACVVGDGVKQVPWPRHGIPTSFSGPGRAMVWCCRSTPDLERLPEISKPAPTVLARITHEELDQLLRGYGWTPYFVEGDEPEKMHQTMAATLDEVVRQVRQIQHNARTQGDTTRPRWPMIVLRSPKGWTGPKVIDGHPPIGEGVSGPSGAALRLAWGVP